MGKYMTKQWFLVGSKLKLIDCDKLTATKVWMAWCEQPKNDLCSFPIAKFILSSMRWRKQMKLLKDFLPNFSQFNVFCSLYDFFFLSSLAHHPNEPIDQFNGCLRILAEKQDLMSIEVNWKPKQNKWMLRTEIAWTSTNCVEIIISSPYNRLGKQS